MVYIDKETFEKWKSITDGNVSFSSFVNNYLIEFVRGVDTMTNNPDKAIEQFQNMKAQLSQFEKIIVKNKPIERKGN